MGFGEFLDLLVIDSDVLATFTFELFLGLFDEGLPDLDCGFFVEVWIYFGLLVVMYIAQDGRLWLS